MRPVAAAVWLAVTMAGLLQQLASSPDGVVDRSSRNLTSVPRDLPRGVESLDLSRNRIRRLGRGDFANASLLRRLNASWNGLEEIDPGAFADTPLLEDLDLSHNSLRNLSAQRYLRHAGNLARLNLHANGFLAMTLGSSFAVLVRLETLALGAESIRAGDFQHLAGAHLHTLNLRVGDTLSYEAGSLADVHARRLQLTYAGDTKAEEHGLLADALSLFDEVELMNLTGGYLELSDQLGRMERIRTSHLYLTSVNIKWKELTICLIAVLRTSIGHLYLSDLTLSHMPYEETILPRTSSVKSLFFRGAVVTSFFFSQEAVYNFFINMPVPSLVLTEVSILHMTCPKAQSPIRWLDLSSCAISDSVFSRKVGDQVAECRGLGNVSSLNLANNNLKCLRTLSMRVQHMESLRHLNLGLNALFYEGVGQCVWPPNVVSVNLSSNRFTGSVFRCLPRGTQRLELQNNQVSVVPSSAFKLENLTSLNLNANRLRELPVCDGFPGLSRLLLRANSFHAPAVDTLRSCPSLKTLDVGENPFTCTCALRDFICLGLRSEREPVAGHTGVALLSWPLDYHCTYPEDLRNTTLKDTWIPEVDCDVRIMAAVILFPAVVLMVTAVALCHRWDLPWYLGMVWQWTRAKHRARRRQARPEDLAGLEFHAFVSYSQRDADWVRDSFLANLEGPAGGLRVCRHETHFVPGKTIIENIMLCVEKSRRCVFVLSAHFVKSDWCHYELYFAGHQRLSLGSDGIVLVLLEPLPKYTIPSKYFQLKSMMDRHTYLEWPQDRAKHRLFWANLRAALQAELPHAPVTGTEASLQTP